MDYWNARRKVDVSNRKLARRVSVPYITLQREIKRNGMLLKKRIECLKWSFGKSKRIPGCCLVLRISHISKNKIVVSDDEKYFNSEMEGCDEFHTVLLKNTSDNVEYQEELNMKIKYKYVALILWQLFSSDMKDM